MCLGTGLSRVNYGADEAPRAPARLLSCHRVTAVHPVRVGELGRVLCGSLGELCDTKFKLAVIFLARPSEGEAVPRLQICRRWLSTSGVASES